MPANSLSDNAIAVEHYLLTLQDRICAAESADGRPALQDAWQRPKAVGARACKTSAVFGAGR